MLVKVTLVDLNPKVVAAFKEAFQEFPEVDVVQGSMLDQNVSAWVTPTNAKGSMSGGLDAVIKGRLGPLVEGRLQQNIKKNYHGVLLVGHAICTPTDEPEPKYVISTPSMMGDSDNVSGTMNTAMACAAAFQAINMQNKLQPGSIRSVALPGLGAGTGSVPPEMCADLMWTGYSLFRRRSFDTYLEMQKALQDEIGNIGPGTVKIPKVPAPTSSNTQSDGDFIPGTFGSVEDLGDVDF